MHVQGKTLPAQILLDVRTSLKAHAILSVSFPALQPQLSLTDPPACPHKAPALQEKDFLLPGSGPWHILFSGSPSLISPLRKILLKVLAFLW